MANEEFLKEFRAAEWRTSEDAKAFVAKFTPLPAGEVLRGLSVILDKRLAQKGAEHRVRCEVFCALVERSATPDLFIPFLKGLREADAVATAALVQILPRVNNVEAHGDLCALLGDDRPNVREAASKVLQKVVGPRAVDTLARLAASDSFAGREEAMEAIMDRALHNGFPVLGAVLRAGAPKERMAALRYLADKKYVAKDLPGAQALISVALRDPHELVVGMALRALGVHVSEDVYWTEAGHLSEAPSPNVRRAFIEGLKGYDSDQTLNYLTRALKIVPVAMRLVILDVLKATGTDRVVPLLTDAIKDKNIPVRTRAADILGELAAEGKVELARAILWLLRSRDVDVRRMAVDLARKVGDPTGQLVPRLLKLLRDEDWWVRERVMDTLVALSGKTLSAHLIRFLSDPSDSVRRFAVGALRRVRDPRTASALCRLGMMDADWWVREEALSCLGDLNDPRVVPYLLRVIAKEPDFRYVAVKALLGLKSRDGVQDVVRCFHEGDGPTRVIFVDYIDAFGEPADIEWLLSRPEEAVPEVRVRIEAMRMARRMAPTGAAVREGLTALDRMLVTMKQMGADDLLLAANRVPQVKRMGAIQPVGETVLGEADVRALLSVALNPAQMKDLDNRIEVDCSYQLKSEGLRFRLNAFYQMSGASAVFRIVRDRIPNMDSLGLPPIVKTFGDLKDGLVLVGGPTGAGKSTTLAALIDYINSNRSRHIVTIEDPIEVVHGIKRCLVNQRESGTHTASFARALKSTLRQDPDVILVGELRDYETVSFAVTAAETGHLVFGTVHTVTADTSIDRVLHVFPTQQRAQVRTMLSESLRAVVCQYLLRRLDNPAERVLAAEVLINNDAIANLIRKDKTYQIPSVLATQREAGMVSMDQSLLTLMRDGLIDPYDAYVRASDKKLFEQKGEGASKSNPPPAMASQKGQAVRSVGA